MLSGNGLKEKNRYFENAAWGPFCSYDFGKKMLQLIGQLPTPMAEI